MIINPDTSDSFADNKEDEILEQPESRWKKYLIRMLALALALAFFLMASFGVLRLFGLPSLEFLIESRELSQDSKIKTLMAAVVTLEAGDRRGTGFNINQRGVIITAGHIVDGADLVQVSFSSGVRQRIDNWINVPMLDLAIISMDNQDLPALELETEKLSETGDEVILIGNPLGFLRVVNRATVVGFTKLEGWDIPVLVIKGPVYKGHSGSPVMNSDGKVIGVIFATATQKYADEIIAFAVPAAEIVMKVSSLTQN